MFKTLFNIIWIFMVIGTSANAHDFSVEHSELTHVISIDRSEEISQ